MNNRAGTILLGIFLITLLSVLAGCSEKNPAESPTTLIQTEMTTATTPTPSPTPTPTPTPTPEVNTDEKLLNKAPNIAGLTKEVQGENVIYEENGKIVAMYNPNVWIGDKQVGGIAVKADKVEGVKVSGDIIPPFNLEKITEDTHFTIENCKNITVTELTGSESNVVVMEFDTPLTLVNSCIENNQFSNMAGFTVKISFEKENGEIIKIDNPAGLIPLSCFEEGATGAENEYYVSDVVDKNTITNFNQEEVYATGESTAVTVKSVMSVWKDLDNLEDTNITDVAVTKEGCVMFSYPQET